MTRWWESLGRGQRAGVVVVALVVGVNLVLSAANSIIGSDPGGPASSAFGTAGDGLEAWADLLADDGRRVERPRTDIAALALDGSETVVIADPVTIDTDDVTALVEFLASGGRLVLAGEPTTPLLGAFTGVDVGWASVPVEDLEVWVPSPHTGGARELAGDRGGRWYDFGPLLPLGGSADGDAALLVAETGSGTVVALADADLLHNRNLAQADNAALALSVVGGADRPVVFAEAVRARPGGFGAMPAAWKWMLAGLGLTAVAGLWSAGARFGPPEPPPVAGRPPRRDHVEAVAAALHRSTDAHPEAPPATDTFPSDRDDQGAAP